MDHQLDPLVFYASTVQVGYEGARRRRNPGKKYLVIGTHLVVGEVHAQLTLKELKVYAGLYGIGEFWSKRRGTKSINVGDESPGSGGE